MLFQDKNIRTKVLMLPVLSLLLMAIMIFGQQYLNNIVMKKVQLPEFGKAVLDGSKSFLQESVNVQAISLGEAVAGVNDPEKQQEIITKLTDSLRFFDDNSGYFFTYNLNGDRVNNPPDKSKNGSNYLQFQDKKGKYLFQEFSKVVRESGGGFVEYHWEKPGAGVTPKLSYVKLIPGTDMYVGCGVYIDNVEAAKAELFDSVKAENSKFNIYRISMWSAVVIIALFVSYLIIRAIILPLNTIVLGLNENSEIITNASRQVAEASGFLADGANQQASSVEQTSGALEEISSMIKQNADATEKAKLIASESSQVAHTGAGAIELMVNAVTKMQKSSEEVSRIIKVIDEIAFQTNLLALNAAVEAARAGESGKGFAVVAEEVRNLAMRSAEAAKSTADLIGESVKNSSISGEVVKNVEESFNSIVDKSESLTEIITGITTACHEQKMGIEQINIAMSQIDQVTQTNASSSEESASASRELSNQALLTGQMVDDLLHQIGRKR